jgi:hypothetical protein
MNTTFTLEPGTEVIASHPRLHPEPGVATVLAPYHTSDIYLSIKWASGRMLVQTHRKNLLSILDPKPRQYSEVRAIESIPTVTKTVTRRTRRASR